MGRWIEFNVVAPVNLALVKYWGKRDESLVLPLHSSLSATLDSRVMRSRCHVKAFVESGEEFDEEQIEFEMTLNGEKVSIHENSRILAVIHEIRSLHGANRMVRIVRLTCENNFPTAAGLASSASGFACLTRALAEVFAVADDVGNERLSMIARKGSGSACRSLMGGFVAWKRGELRDGSDSMASQIVDETHWPELRIVILIAHGGPKEIGSTIGMRLSVETSDLLRYRAEHIVEPRMIAMERAIREKNFSRMAELTMKESNQFHAICMDTFPPISYLNETSKRIIQVVHALNAEAGDIIAAYSFDAGPNAVIFTLDQHLCSVLDIIQAQFPASRGKKSYVEDVLGLLSVRSESKLSTSFLNEAAMMDALERIIVTRVGPGAQIIDNI